jgi:hypothetical protein
VTRPALGFSIGLFAATLLVAPAARAEPGDATRLEYLRSERAQSCPDRAELQSAVVKRLGYDPFFIAARQTIVVEITDADGELHAQMRLVDDRGIITGSRELREKLDDCRELLASLALAISIALDPSIAFGGEPARDDDAQGSPTPKEATPSAPEPSAREAIVEANVAPAKAVKATDKSRVNAAWTPALRSLALRLSGFGALGIAPALAFGLRAGGAVRVDWFELVVEFDDQFAATRGFAAGSAEVSLQGGVLAPCWIRAWYAACATLELGSLRASGSGVQNPAVERTTYFAAGARTELSPKLIGHLHGLLTIEATKSLVPVALRLREREVWSTPFASVSGALGLELRFQ